MDLSSWINTILQGVLTGGLYALFAAGLALSFGVMRQVNLAHGDLIVAAGYGTLAAALALLPSSLGSVAPWVALAGVLPLAALVGYGLQRVLLNPTIGRDMLAPVMVTYGLSIVLQNALLLIFTADVRQINVGRLTSGGFNLTPAISVGWLPVLTFALAITVLIGLHLLLSRTQLGRVMRAVSDDPETARLMGLDPRRIYAVAMAISAVLMAVAGTLMIMRTATGPLDGPVRLLFAFEAIIIGGMGSLWGTLLGGMVLGVAQAIGAALDPGWGVLTGHLVFLLVLLIRPQGLFPKVRDR